MQKATSSGHILNCELYSRDLVSAFYRARRVGYTDCYAIRVLSPRYARAAECGLW